MSDIDRAVEVAARRHYETLNGGHPSWDELPEYARAGFRVDAGVVVRALDEAHLLADAPLHEDVWPGTGEPDVRRQVTDWQVT